MKITAARIIVCSPDRHAPAARHPYQRAYLPVARKLDGTLTDW